LLRKNSELPAAIVPHINRTIFSLPEQKSNKIHSSTGIGSEDKFFNYSNVPSK
jgi:hypothetical protein